MEPLSNSNAHLIGLFVEFLATGVYFGYLPRCAGILMAKVRSESISWLHLAFIFILLCTIGNLMVELYTGYRAFGIHAGSNVADPMDEFVNVSSPESVTNGVFSVVLAMFSDLIMIYRTFLVWNSSVHVIVVPVFLLLGSWGLGIWSLYDEAHAGIFKGRNIVGHVTTGIRYFNILTFCLNIICCGKYAWLICWRIWRVASQTSPHLSRSSSTSRIMYVIIESAALYCANLLALIVTNFMQSNAFFVFRDLLPPVNAIVFSLLITRSHAAASDQHPTSTTIRFATDTHRSDHETMPGASMPFEAELGLGPVGQTYGIPSHADSAVKFSRV